MHLSPALIIVRPPTKMGPPSGYVFSRVFLKTTLIYSRDNSTGGCTPKSLISKQHGASMLTASARASRNKRSHALFIARADKLFRAAAVSSHSKSTACERDQVFDSFVPGFLRMLFEVVCGLGTHQSLVADR